MALRDTRSLYPGCEVACVSLGAATLRPGAAGGVSRRWVLGRGRPRAPLPASRGCPADRRPAHGPFFALGSSAKNQVPACQLTRV